VHIIKSIAIAFEENSFAIPTYLKTTALKAQRLLV
jgi:hypothetical protein